MNAAVKRYVAQAGDGNVAYLGEVDSDEDWILGDGVQVVLATEYDALLAEAEKKLTERKRAPVQGWAAGIPWDMHLEAYSVYCKKYGAQEALITGWCRGGFGTDELDMFIPGWRDRISRITALESQLQAMRTALERYKVFDVDALRAERDALESKLQAMREPCVWKEHGGLEAYVTGCGSVVMYMYKFCPYCGHPIKEAT